MTPNLIKKLEKDSSNMATSSTKAVSQDGDNSKEQEKID